MLASMEETDSKVCWIPYQLLMGISVPGWAISHDHVKIRQARSCATAEVKHHGINGNVCFIRTSSRSHPSFHQSINVLSDGDVFKKGKVSGTGIEPVSPAWKAKMLTTTPTALELGRAAWMLHPLRCDNEGQKPIDLNEEHRIDG